MGEVELAEAKKGNVRSCWVGPEHDLLIVVLSQVVVVGANGARCQVNVWAGVVVVHVILVVVV